MHFELRTIILISQAAKSLLRILRQKLKNIMEKSRVEDTMVFRLGGGPGIPKRVGDRYVERVKEHCLCFTHLKRCLMGCEEMM